MKKTVFTASCPVCGRVLFKGSPHSYMEGGCPKCKEYLQISFTESGYEAAILTNGREAGQPPKQTEP